MKQDIENIIKKWLKKHKDDGQWVSDYDGEFDLDSCCLDGDFDLNDLADEVLKVVSVGLKEFMKRNYGSLNHQVCSRAMTIDDMIEGIENYLLTLSTNKENKNND